MANIWKPTQAECDLIRQAAARAAGTKGIKLEPGIKCGDAGDDSMNWARVSNREDFEDTDLADFGTWAQFRKGVELTEDGRAVVDFYVHDRIELNTNVVAYYQGGELVEVRAVGGLNLLSVFGIAKHYVHPAPVAPVACSHEIVQGVCHACGQSVDAAVFAPVAVPTLKIDGLLYKGRTIPYHGKVERRIVANLIAHMAFHGWAINSVWDGEEDEKATDMVSAMELVFNLDECRLYFKKNNADGTPVVHNVYVVLGNGVDCLADWNYAADDADGFNSVMEKFDCDEFA